eukprot:1054181-Pelagomonas_calceolata.AAC.1
MTAASESSKAHRLSLTHCWCMHSARIVQRAGHNGLTVTVQGRPDGDTLTALQQARQGRRNVGEHF